MLINRPMTRAMWRKLALSFREASNEPRIPEYRDENERSMNYRYYR